MAGIFDLINNAVNELPEYVINFAFDGAGYQLYCWSTPDLTPSVQSAFFNDLKAGLAADGGMTGVNILKLSSTTETL